MRPVGMGMVSVFCRHFLLLLAVSNLRRYGAPGASLERLALCWNQRLLACDLSILLGAVLNLLEKRHIAKGAPLEGQPTDEGVVPYEELCSHLKAIIFREALVSLGQH